MADIPMDYDGAMGVPITFLDKYNPDQFEIIGISKLSLPSRCRGTPLRRARLRRRTRTRRSGKLYVPADGDGRHRRVYERIVIKRIGATS